VPRWNKKHGCQLLLTNRKQRDERLVGESAATSQMDLKAKPMPCQCPIAYEVSVPAVSRPSVRSVRAPAFGAKVHGNGRMPGRWSTIHVWFLRSARVRGHHAWQDTPVLHKPHDGCGPGVARPDASRPGFPMRTGNVGRRSRVSRLAVGRGSFAVAFGRAVQRNAAAAGYH